MRAPIFKQRLVQTLWQNVEANYDLYINGGFDDLLAGPQFANQVREVESVTIREQDFVNLINEPGGSNDGENAFIIYNALEGMTPNKAFDERIWTAITHTVGFEFAKKRWALRFPQRDQNMQSIKTHFFGKVGGKRGLHRNNAFASLWWWAHIVRRGSTEENFKSRLSIFLKETDVRAQIIDRPTSSRVVQVADALIDCVVDKMSSDPDSRFFKSPRQAGALQGPYREWLKKVDLAGGRHLYNAYTKEELKEKFKGFMLEIEQARDMN